MHIKFCKILWLTAVISFSGCAMTSSGNFVGEAGALKYSTDEKKYHFAETAWMMGEAENYKRPYHADGNIDGGSYHFRANLFSLDYSLFGQKGGFFLSVPVSIPMDIGIRPSFVQWVGPFYGGAGISFVGGYYPSEESDDAGGRLDGFALYSFGGGFLADMGKIFSVGAYATWERIAFNAYGSWYEKFLEDLFQEKHGLPSVAYRKMVTTLGVQAFWHFKLPLGIYAEYAPSALFHNDGVTKVKLGAVLLY